MNHRFPSLSIQLVETICEEEQRINIHRARSGPERSNSCPRGIGKPGDEMGGWETGGCNGGEKKPKKTKMIHT